MYIVLDGLGIFLVFLFRVGVVKTQIALALIIQRKTKVQTYRFGMADMQVPVRFGRETRDDAAVLATGQIGINDRADKIGRCGCRRAAHVGFFPACIELMI